jgi:hypothetical protein
MDAIIIFLPPHAGGERLNGLNDAMNKRLTAGE